MARHSCQYLIRGSPSPTPYLDRHGRFLCACLTRTLMFSSIQERFDSAISPSPLDGPPTTTNWSKVKSQVTRAILDRQLLYLAALHISNAVRTFGASKVHETILFPSVPFRSLSHHSLLRSFVLAGFVRVSNNRRNQRLARTFAGNHNNHSDPWHQGLKRRTRPYSALPTLGHTAEARWKPWEACFLLSPGEQQAASKH